MTDNIYEVYLNTLNESLNSPYKYKWENIDSEDAYGVFKTAGGDKIRLSIEKLDDVHMVEFFSENKSHQQFDLTNDNDSLRIMSTVILMIKDFIVKYKDEISEIYFSAEKTDKSRARVYLKIVKKYMLSGWKVSTIETNNVTQFYISNNNFKK